MKIRFICVKSSHEIKETCFFNVLSSSFAFKSCIFWILLAVLFVANPPNVWLVKVFPCLERKNKIMNNICDCETVSLAEAFCVLLLSSNGSDGCARHPSARCIIHVLRAHTHTHTHSVAPCLLFPTALPLFKMCQFIVLIPLSSPGDAVWFHRTLSGWELRE